MSATTILPRTKEVIETLESIKGSGPALAGAHLASLVTAILILNDEGSLPKEMSSKLVSIVFAAATAIGISRQDLHTLGEAIARDFYEGAKQ